MCICFLREGSVHTSQINDMICAAFSQRLAVTQHMLLRGIKALSTPDMDSNSQPNEGQLSELDSALQTERQTDLVISSNDPRKVKTADQPNTTTQNLEFPIKLSPISSSKGPPLDHLGAWHWRTIILFLFFITSLHAFTYSATHVPIIHLHVTIYGNVTLLVHFSFP